MPKVTLELSDDTAQWLRSMASVGRLCDSINRALQAGMDALPDGEVVNRLAEAQEDIAHAKPALMEFHSRVRQVLVEMGVEPLWPQ